MRKPRKQQQPTAPAGPESSATGRRWTTPEKSRIVRQELRDGNAVAERAEQTGEGAQGHPYPQPRGSCRATSYTDPWRHEELTPPPSLEVSSCACFCATLPSSTICHEGTPANAR